MRDPKEALENWLRILKPGGHLVCLIPDEDLYEQGVFLDLQHRPQAHLHDLQEGLVVQRQHQPDATVGQPVGGRRDQEDRADGRHLPLPVQPAHRRRPVRPDRTAVGECAIEFVLKKIG
ncbi:hypothetical protein ACRAWD_01360 [Caulobacter segnis]